MKEADLFPIVKKMFKEQGYTVYAEVAHYLRGIDLVAIKGDEHIAVELKLQFNYHLFRQANWNIVSFNKSYVAYPVKKPFIFESEKMSEYRSQVYGSCVKAGIGILQILPHGTIFEALEAKEHSPYRKIDYTHYKESEEDVGGLPCQKGVSAGYHELESIKQYVRKNPQAKWQEIFDNVHTHYANKESLAGAMRQWRGFSLGEFKKTLPSFVQKQDVKTLNIF